MSAGALTGRDLERARADIEATWPGTAVILAPGTAIDAEGSWTETYTASGTVAALLHPESGGPNRRETEYAGRLRDVTGYILSCPHTVELTGDSLVTYQGTDYRVETVREWGPAAIATRAIVTRVEGT